MEEEQGDIKGVVDGLRLVLEESGDDDENEGGLWAAEKIVVNVLEWRFNVKTCAHFLGFYDGVGGCFRECEDGEWVRGVARRLMDLVRRDDGGGAFKGEIVASACVGLAREFERTGGLLVGDGEEVVRGVWGEDVTDCAEVVAAAYRKACSVRVDLAVSPRCVRDTARDQRG